MVMINYIIFFVTLFSKGYCIGIPWLEGNLETKIIGGQISSGDSFLCVVPMIFTQPITGSQYMCGGSIIDPQNVITAAHCVSGMISVEIRVGSKDLRSGGKTYKSYNMAAHPLYDPVTTKHDIAIVKFKEIYLDGVTANACKMIDSGQELHNGLLCKTAGWGTTDSGYISEVLREVDVPIVETTKCQEMYKEINQTVDAETMICAGDTINGGKDSCQGDSGGPLTYKENNTMVGITSHGEGCGLPNSPGVYTKLSKYRPWIEKEMNKPMVIPINTVLAPVNALLGLIFSSSS